jgi:sn-glycerol 3-phosphate transport system substrate-binding protein
VTAESRGGGYRGILQDAIQAADDGDAPHLVQLFEVGTQLAMDSGVFTAIGDVGGLDPDRYVASMLTYYMLDGAVQAIPFNASSPVLIANETLLVEASLDGSPLPETFGELASVCDDIDNVGLSASCITFPLHGWLVEQWMAQQGALLANNGNGRDARATEVLLDGEPARRIGRFMADLADGGWYAYTGTPQDWAGSRATFLDQDAVFLVTSSADIGRIVSDAAAAGFDVTTGLLPIPDGVTRNGVVVGGAAIWLTDGHPTDENELARDFVQFLTSAENMAAWHELTGYVPVVDAAATLLEDGGWFAANPSFAVAFEQFEATTANDATAGAVLGSFLSLRTTVEEALLAIYDGTATIDDAFAQAKVEADADLAAYNAAVEP